MIPEDARAVKSLDNLLDIETPGLSGQEVQVPATIASNSISYTIPVIMKVKCLNHDDKHTCEKEASFAVDLKDYPKFTEVSDFVRERILINLFKNSENTGFNHKCSLVVKDPQTTTIKRIRARPVVKNLLSKDGKFYDSMGREWKSIDIFVLQNGLATQPGKHIELTGLVLPDPRSSRITMMARHVNEAQEASADIEEMNRLAKLFENWTVEQRMDWIIKNVATYAKVVKRENVIHGALLCFFSPLYLNFNGEKIKGWMKIVIIGDSTAGKSKTVRTVINELFGLGQIISGEMASMAGLAAANMQASSGQWMIEYGPFVLMDAKLLAVDGAHKVSASDWAAIGEAERDGILRVTKAGKAEANARTRLILIYNPVTEDRRFTRAMDTFRRGAQAIETVMDATSIARTDLAIFVNASDVTPEDIHIVHKGTTDPELQCLTSLCRHVWTGKYETIFEDKALEKILSEATRIQKKYYLTRIPLASPDIDKKLARLSASLAALTCSFSSDWSTLTVKQEHVDYVVNLLESEYENAGLGSLAMDDRQEVTPDEAATLIQNMQTALGQKALDDKVIHEMINWISGKEKFTREDMMHKFRLSDKEQLRPLVHQMKEDGLLKQGNRGFTATLKLTKLSKVIGDKNNAS
ncbi:minichromosome maintenance protein MCM [Candidatus Nitrososphaera gargensis]|nr:minichromosome maintenance protein MCM [Candidatus Nitrososphaera gargensis]